MTNIEELYKNITDDDYMDGYCPVFATYFLDNIGGEIVLYREDGHHVVVYYNGNYYDVRGKITLQDTKDYFGHELGDFYHAQDFDMTNEELIEAYYDASFEELRDMTEYHNLNR